MNRSRFNSPAFSSYGHNSPDPNWKSTNVSGLRESLSPDFIPFEYSSPLSSFKNSDNRNRRSYNSTTMRNRSFNSPRSVGSSFNSPYNSFGFNNSGDFRKSNFKSRSKPNIKPNSSYYDSKLYFNNSMIEDPWEELEKQQAQEMGFEVTQNSANDLVSDRMDSDNESSKIDDEDVDACSSPDEDVSCSTPTTTTISSSNSDSLN